MRKAENGVKQRRNEATPSGVLTSVCQSLSLRKEMWGDVRVSIALRGVSLGCGSSRLEVQPFELFVRELDLQRTLQLAFDRVRVRKGTHTHLPAQACTQLGLDVKLSSWLLVDVLSRHGYLLAGLGVRETVRKRKERQAREGASGGSECNQGAGKAQAAQVMLSKDSDQSLQAKVAPMEPSAPAFENRTAADLESDERTSTSEPRWGCCFLGWDRQAVSWQRGHRVDS